jgi:hypothetical protein
MKLFVPLVFGVQVVLASTECNNGELAFQGMLNIHDSGRVRLSNWA